MKALLYLLFVIANCNSYRISNVKRKQIVGGEEIDVTEAPFIAQILRYEHAICGATIISPDWLLTASHCVTYPRGLSILTGTRYRNTGGSNHEIEKIIMHPDFANEIYDHDIALIKLMEPLKFSNVTKAIQISVEEPKVGDKLKVSGYGKEGDLLPVSRVLKSAIVPVIDFKVCQKKYKDDTLTENMFCAGIGDNDTCDGDSGGPATLDGYLIGIISNGDECGSKDFAGVYTKIHNYIDWIDEVLASD